MDSALTFGIAHVIGMTLGGIVAHFAVQGYQQRTSITIRWGEQNSSTLQAPDDVLECMRPFYMIKDVLNVLQQQPSVYDKMCYCLQSLYATLKEVAEHPEKPIKHETMFACQGLIERIVEYGADFLRYIVVMAPESFDEVQQAYDQLEQTLEKESNSLRYLYEQTLRA